RPGGRARPRPPPACRAPARQALPAIRMLFVGAVGLDGDALERRLYVLRRVIHARVGSIFPHQRDSFYICSLSSRTLIYKGMLMADQLPRLYADLVDPSTE